VTSMKPDDLTRSDKRTQMHAKHGIQRNRPADRTTSTSSTPIRSHTRIAHSTLSTPHARATRCSVSTCRHVRS